MPFLQSLPDKFIIECGKEYDFKIKGIGLYAAYYRKGPLICDYTERDILHKVNNKVWRLLSSEKEDRIERMVSCGG